MTHTANEGDTVRMTITLTFEGTVKKYSGKLYVEGMDLDGNDRTVEVLGRKLPIEPGYYLSENDANAVGVLQLTAGGNWWWVGNKHRPHPEMLTHDDARTYGQLQRLTVHG